MFAFHEVYISLRFPQKLWKLVNESKTNAIKWNRNGNSFLIDYKDFQHEYLNATSNPFKTTRLQSFIRQLNLYGFRKVKSHMHPKEPFDTPNINVHEFFHVNFIRGRYDLLAKIVRKTDSARVRTKTRNCTSNRQKPLNRVNACQMALTSALEKVSVKFDFQAYKDKEATVKNETVEAVDNIMQDMKPTEADGKVQENWDYSKWLEETSSKYNSLQASNDVPSENSEITCLGSTGQVTIQEIQDNENVVYETNGMQILNDANENKEETLVWDGIVYNDTSEQLYAMLLANEKKNIAPKVITESLEAMSYQSPVYCDHRYSIPLGTSTLGLIWN